MADEEEKVCRVYDSNDSFTAWVQFLLACMALASLWIKRMNEVPRRKFWTWFMDVSKQAFGACYAHVLNMIIAAVIAGNVRGEVALEDQCAWYAINYLIDTTLGLVLSIGFLRLLDYVANQRDWVSLKHTGVYVGKEGIIHWIHQMLAWLGILSIVKAIICLFMWLFSAPLAYAGAVLFAPLQSNIRFELLFVMIFFPGVLNVIYFWITDGYLKANAKHSAAHETPEFVDTGGLVADAICDVDYEGSLMSEDNNKDGALSKMRENAGVMNNNSRGQYKGPTISSTDGTNQTLTEKVKGEFA